MPMNPMWGSAGGMAGAGLGAGLGAMFGDYENPAHAANPYFDQMPDILKRYLGPYAERGNRLGGMLEGQYGNLLGDPGGMVNRIGQGYQQSPGFQFALQQALQGAGHAQAAGGMAGSPQHEQTNMGIATGLANQDYNNWIKNALGMYGEGLHGAQGGYGIGAGAGMGLGEDLASILAQRAKLAYEGQNAENQRQGGLWGGLGGLLGSAAGLAGSAFI